MSASTRRVKWPKARPRHARAVYDIAVAAGCRFTLEGTLLTFNVPPHLPPDLRNKLTLHIGLAAKGICELPEVGGGP